jgi:hypothetical protein
MLGEIVVHSGDIRYPLGQPNGVNPEALIACLDMYKAQQFPTGAKKRVEGLRLVATDLGWSYGSGPEVTGPGLSLLLAMTGRPAVLVDLSGTGVDTLQSRMGPAQSSP